MDDITNTKTSLSVIDLNSFSVYIYETLLDVLSGETSVSVSVTQVERGLFS